MTVFRVGNAIPDWCQLRHLEFLEVGVGESRTIERQHPNEVLLITYGTGRLKFDDSSVVVRESQFFIVPDHANLIEMSGTIRPVHVLRFAGVWGKHIYGCGFFNVALDIRSQFVGDAVTYPKATSFDSHYHDYDEYWVILEGSGTVVVGDKSYFVRQGDCIAIGAGYNHDFPLVDTKVKAGYFEISAVGEGRIGHLWEYEHGKAVRASGRG